MRGIKSEKLKQEAMRLRHLGWSYPMIEKKLGVPKATMSSWLSSLKLSKSARQCISARKKENLVKLRHKALEVKHTKWLKNKQELQIEVSNCFENYNFDIRIRELLLAMLYLGEGFKGRSCLGLGNSNPEIIRLFVRLVRDIYDVDEKKFRCFLHLRMDQKEIKEKKFWSKQAGIPLINFRKTQFDERTAGQKTWTNYHGVCIIYYYDAAFDKRLSEVQRMIIKKILGL